MLPDRSLQLQLRSNDHGRIAEALVVVRPDNPRYMEYLDHVGGLAPGEAKPIPPWASASRTHKSTQ